MFGVHASSLSKPVTFPHMAEPRSGDRSAYDELSSAAIRSCTSCPGRRAAWSGRSSARPEVLRKARAFLGLELRGRHRDGDGPHARHGRPPEGAGRVPRRAGPGLRPHEGPDGPPHEARGHPPPQGRLSRAPGKGRFVVLVSPRLVVPDDLRKEITSWTTTCRTRARSCSPRPPREEVLRREGPLGRGREKLAMALKGLT